MSSRNMPDTKKATPAFFLLAENLNAIPTADKTSTKKAPKPSGCPNESGSHFVADRAIPKTESAAIQNRLRGLISCVTAKVTKLGFFSLTSKMSHDPAWRDSWLCRRHDR